MRRLIDLTQTLARGCPVWPGTPPLGLRRTADYDAGYRSYRLELEQGTGTHVDAPAHFVPGGRTIDELTVAELVAPAVVFRLRGEPDGCLAASQVAAWEVEHGPVPHGALALLDTGWHRRWAEAAAYLNQDADGVMHFPGFSAEAAELLLERGVVGLGIDTLSPDGGRSTDFPVHHLVLRANRYQVENLANLDQLPAAGAAVTVGVLRIDQVTEAPARVVAVVDSEEPRIANSSPACGRGRPTKEAG